MVVVLVPVLGVVVVVVDGIEVVVVVDDVLGGVLIVVLGGVVLGAGVVAVDLRSLPPWSPPLAEPVVCA